MKIKIIVNNQTFRTKDFESTPEKFSDEFIDKFLTDGETINYLKFELENEKILLLPKKAANNAIFVLEL